MNEIMQKVNELYTMLVAKNEAADALDKKLRVEAGVQLKVTEVQAEKDADLKARETEVVKVENVLEIERKNKETLAQIVQGKGSLADATSAHNAQVAKDKADIGIREKGIVDDFKTLKDGQAKLAEGEKKLAEDRENMKKQVIEKIAEGIK